MHFKILIAEDEDITRKHLIYALKKEGYDVVGTRNGREALEQIETRIFRYTDNRCKDAGDERH